jgi:dTDP-4-dehydrorhamnose 3,5-epimerase
MLLPLRFERSLFEALIVTTARIQEASPAKGPTRLPAGVIVRPLTPHSDERGTFCELFRDSWELGPRPVQWNMVRSSAGVLRGVHAHLRHADLLSVAVGEMLLGLHDLRDGSPSCGMSVMLRLTADDPSLVTIPVGVAHGFYFPIPSLHIYAVTSEFDGNDEFGCRWDDPALHLDWPCRTPLLSQRDRDSGSLSAMRAELASRGAVW